MNFYEEVYKMVKKVPHGKVATYAQIATMISSPRAARVVGFALRALGDRADDVPWQRIINSEGRISIQNLKHAQSEQADLLKKEGIEVEFRDKAYWVDLKKYLYTFRSKN
jgi:methylated-DNA-protein-cysteine methyltransferase-like protein